MTEAQDMLKFSEDELKNEELMILKELKFIKEIDVTFCHPAQIHKNQFKSLAIRA